MDNSVFITCSGCSRQNKLGSLFLGELNSYHCQYCGIEIVSSKEKPESIEMKPDVLETEDVQSQYVYGSWSKRRKRTSTFFTVFNLSVLLAAVIFLGAGKIDDTYIVGVKRKPGLSNVYVTSHNTTVSGQYLVDRKIKRDFSYVVMRYSEKSGLVFFKEI